MMGWRRGGSPPDVVPLLLFFLLLSFLFFFHVPGLSFLSGACRRSAAGCRGLWPAKGGDEATSRPFFPPPPVFFFFFFFHFFFSRLSPSSLLPRSTRTQETNRNWSFKTYAGGAGSASSFFLSFLSFLFPFKRLPLFPPGPRSYVNAM